MIKDSYLSKYPTLSSILSKINPNDFVDLLEEEFWNVIEDNVAFGSDGTITLIETEHLKILLQEAFYAEDIILSLIDNIFTPLKDIPYIVVQ